MLLTFSKSPVSFSSSLSLVSVHPVHSKIAMIDAKIKQNIFFMTPSVRKILSFRYVYIISYLIRKRIPQIAQKNVSLYDKAYN